MGFLKNVAYIFPVMFYYLLESLILGVVIFLIWRFLLFQIFKFPITYFQWVGIIWIIKVLFFDIFKLINNGGVEDLTDFVGDEQE